MRYGHWLKKWHLGPWISVYYRFAFNWVILTLFMSDFILELMLRWAGEDMRCSSWIFLMAFAILPTVRCLHPMVSCALEASYRGSFAQPGPVLPLFWTPGVWYTVRSIDVVLDRCNVHSSMLQSEWHAMLRAVAAQGWNMSLSVQLSPVLYRNRDNVYLYLVPGMLTRE